MLYSILHLLSDNVQEGWLLLTWMPIGYQAVAFPDIHFLLRIARTYLCSLQSQVTQKRILPLDVQLTCDFAEYVGSERLGQHVDRRNGQGCWVYIPGFRSELLNVVPHFHLLRHLCLCDIFADNQGDFKAVLCIHGEACRSDESKAQRPFSSSQSSAWQELLRLAGCTGLLSLPDLCRSDRLQEWTRVYRCWARRSPIPPSSKFNPWL